MKAQIDRRDKPRTITPVAGAVALLTTVVGAVFVTLVIDLRDEAAGLTAEAAAALDQSGVTHPVTAVLLNFRAYDTWLEVSVLVLAIFAVFVLHRTNEIATGSRHQPDPVLTLATRWLVPVMILVAGYLLWLGSHAPGGAFQAGAVLAAAGVLLMVAGLAPLKAGRAWPIRLITIAGFVLFLIVAVLLLASGRPLLEYPPGWSGDLILVLEAAVTITIAATLAALFAAARPQRPAEPTETPR